MDGDNGDFFRKSYAGDNLGFYNEEFEEEETYENKLKEENYYKYHENVQEYDPRGQPYSYFYITVMGQVEFGEFLELDGLSLSYCFIAGEDWSISDGIKTA